MKKFNFSPEVEGFIVVQALDHILFGNDFHKNFENVKDLEDKIGLTIFDSFDVIYILIKLSETNKYFSIVSRNALEYVKVARDELVLLEGDEKKNENELINLIIECNRLNSNHYEYKKLEEYLRAYCFDCIDIWKNLYQIFLKAYKEKKSFTSAVEKEVCAFIANNFLYTKQIILASDAEAVKSCSLDMQFLRYVKFVSLMYSEVFLSPSFRDNILSTLLLNDSLLLERGKSDVLTDDFFKRNKQAMHLVRKLAEK